MSKTQTKSGKDRSIEERVSYAVGHRVRIEVLAALNERSYSAADLARIVHQPLSTVTHHVEELLKSGSIEVARTQQIRNVSQNFYRAVEVPFFSDEQMTAKTPEERQEIYGLILQASMAEALASFWAGKITEDPRVMMAWNWLNVDEQGREEIANELAELWSRVEQIEARSVARRVQSGEEAQSIVVTTFGYPRSRTSPQSPLTSGDV